MSIRLNLIDYYYQYLASEQVIEATICFFDKGINQYKNQDLMNTLISDQNITVYHLKMPRVFTKEYPLDNVSDSILEFVLENPDVMVLDYQDLTDDIKDAYYQKSIKNIKCQYLHLIKVFEDEQVRIVLLAYSKKNSLNFKLSTLRTLEKKLHLVEEEKIVNQLNQYIVDNSNNYYLYNEKMNKMYFSKTLQEIMHVKPYYERTSKKGVFDEVNGEINRLIRLSKTNVFEIEGTKVYFFKEIKQTDSKVYSLYNLELNKKNDHLTIIYLCNQSFIEWNFVELISKLDKIFKESLVQEYDYYQISDSEFYVIVDNLIEQRILEKIKTKIEALNDDNLELVVFYLNTAYNISISNLNFIALSKYLRYAISHGQTKFDKNEYKKYLHLILEAKYFSEEVIGQESFRKKVTDSVTSLEVGDYLGYYHLDLEKPQKASFYHHASEYIFRQAAVLTGDKLYFRIHYGEFTNKKVWFNLRRITGFKECFIILSEVEISSQNDFRKFILDLDRLHALGFKIFVDSSIYASIMMNDVISHFEGIYLEDYEMSIGDMEGDSLFKAVVSFYLKENKIILLHQLQGFYQFKDPNVLYINEK